MIYDKVNKYLKGGPNHLLTIALLIVSAIAAYVALRAKPAMKAAVAAWFIAP